MLVSLAWRSRALRMARVQNKVVPSERETALLRPAASAWAMAPTHFRHTEVKWNSPGGFSISVIMACTGSNLKVIRKTFHMNDRRCDT